VSAEVAVRPMREAEIPDKNIFMMCARLNPKALADLPVGYAVRSCHPDELQIWEFMTKETYQRLKIVAAARQFLNAVNKYDTNQF
jgi:hypothetical protein